MTLSKMADAGVGAKNKARIMDAAEKAFAQNGFKGTSVQQIADGAGLPKTNVLYYFKSKQDLYLAVLQQTLSLWNSRFDQATAEDDPAEILASYITEKVEMSRTHPVASKIFAMEILNGAPNLNRYFDDEHAKWMASRIAILKAWMDSGKMRRMDPYYLLFHIWSSTQHYADFAVQVTRLRGAKMKKADYQAATQQLIEVILTGCGLTVPEKYRSSI
ncbi:TetR family transcriptional regulator [Alteromonas aestuariivivens]|uniref:TetR family transcriptional regulator n=1 Tax=Alteromonas aestuariivivens TaxID=1938339 RepID=A0A3D8MBT1_9ALTE|nr:TetR family transcriptional regulator C-terminal domain-containing protein [Alteromonas aestuariivivens]RDV27535.1 TetR family transcriptional regulator [Alteromonas aestuariivivens]